MKQNEMIFMNNLVECAKEAYIKCYNLAINNDFCKNKDALKRLDDKVFTAYYKYRYKYLRKLKKMYKIFIYTSGMIYNNEIIVDVNLCYDLNVLLAINKLKLYKVHKFIQFIDSEEHIRCIVPGIRYSDLHRMIDKILRGVKC